MVKSIVQAACRRAVSSHRVLGSRAYATALPITATGPPPAAPSPSPKDYGERIAQRRKKAELLQRGKDLRAAQDKSPKSPLKKRFWQHVNIINTEEGYQIHLDKRPVRTPSKQILTVPKSKPFLAHAIAIEWDLLVSAQQALKGHNIPMTGIVCRALDLVDEERAGKTKIRDEIVGVMMRYLDTDTLLCWAPESTLRGDESSAENSLRETQRRAAEDVLGYLNATVWPGVEIKPTLDANSILPAQQSEVSKSIIRGWLAGLGPWELAGLERAALASKSLLVAVRLIVEWSENFDIKAPQRFGVEEAALASTIEVRWQTGMWGEVEDTHDVENEDIRRQLGSVVLVVSGVKQSV